MRLSSVFLAIHVLLVNFASARAEDFSLTILHINDVHSRIQAINKYNSTCKPKGISAGKCFGGMARVKSAIDARRTALKNAGKHVITLDAGDQFQGSLFYTTYKGSVAVEVMNRIGFDAMAVGNHEFDDGPEALAAFARAANFPILFANSDLEKEPQLAALIKSHIVKTIAGERIAIISVLAEDTDVTSSPGPNVKFLQSETVLTSLIQKLEATGVNKIILLSHVGLKRDQELAAKVSGIDVIVGGHSHTHLKTYPKRIDGPDGESVPIVQAFAYSKFLGELEVTWNKDGDVVSAKGKAHLLDANIKEDVELASFIKSKAEPFEALRKRVVGHVAEEIDGSSRRCRTGDCPMGKLIAEAMLDRVRSQGIAIAFQHGGGIRASFSAGKVTMGDVLAALPFQNTIATFQLQGSDIRAALENGVSQRESRAGRFPQLAGMKFSFLPTAEVGNRVKDVMVQTIDGSFAPLEADKVYGVVSNNYLRAGGDGYAVFRDKAHNVYDFGPNLGEVLAVYLGKTSPVEPFSDQRITAIK